MDLAEITSDIGSYTKDCVLITRTEPVSGLGPEIVWCNTAFTEMTGYTLDDVCGNTPRILQGPDTSRDALSNIRTSLEEWKPVVQIVKKYTKSGEPYWSELSIMPVADPSGWFRYWVSIQRDVTSRVERERHLEARNLALTASEKVLQEEKIHFSGIAAVAEHAQDYITITDLDFRILWANPAFVRKSGYPMAAIRGSLHCDLLSKRGEVYTSREMAQKAIMLGEFEDGEVMNVSRSGEEYWTDLRVSVQRDEDGMAERLVIVERDITEQRRVRTDLERSRREIEIAAVRDPLTGILNRRGMEDQFKALAARAMKQKHGVGLLHIDLDRFKQINDTLGHAAGDAVLLAVTERIQRHLGPDAFAARVGGDEFVVVVELQSAEQDLSGFATRLKDGLAQPVKFDDGTCRFSASIGFSTRHKPPFDVSALMIEADIALYRAKNKGRDDIQAFTEDLASETRRKKVLSDQLVVAIENGELQACYQPQFCTKTQKLVGAETLVRWQHPDMGLLPPSKFLPLARELNLERIIDQQMMARALEDLDLMRRAGVDLPKISVNVSSRRLYAQDLIEELDHMGPACRDLTFELLESTFLDDSNEQLLWTLDALRERGIGIEIDDFGTGHASIAGLLRVKPDKLKTDRSLLNPDLNNSKAAELFGLVVQIGKTLEIDVIAEGVETALQLELASELGCSVVQGFLFAEPLPTSRFIRDAHTWGADPDRMSA